MAIGDDFAIDYINKRIYSTGATVYSVNALYTYLMDTFDEQGAMDDTVPMSAQTPTAFTIINGWFIDDVTTNYLNGGAIATSGYSGSINIVQLASGWTNCVVGDLGNQVNVGGVATGSLLAYNNITGKWWVRTAGTIPNASSVAIAGGTGAGSASGDSVTGEELYPNVYTLGTIVSDAKVYLVQNGAKITPDWWGTGHVDLLVKTTEAGVEIDAGNVTILARNYTDIYDNYLIDLSAGGRNAVPLATADDLNNQTAVTGSANYIDKIRVVFTNAQLNYVSGSGNAPAVGKVLYDSGSKATGFLLSVGLGGSGSFTLGNVSGSFVANNIIQILSELNFKNQTVQYSLNQWVSGSTSLASGSLWKVEQVTTGSNGILYLANVTGTFQDNETLKGSVTGSSTSTGSLSSSTFIATGSAFSIIRNINKDLDNAAGIRPYDVVIDLNGRTVAQLYEYCKTLNRRTSDFKMYPVIDSTISPIDGEQYVTASGSYAPVKASPLGSFAGGVFFGARGVWIEDMASADVQKYSLTDSLGVIQNPPNLQSFTVSAVEVGDRILICLTTGDNYTINRSQYVATGSGSGVQYIGVTGSGIPPLPSDTPSLGVIRVRYNVDAENEGEDIYSYSAIDKTNGIFTLSGSTTTNRAYTANDRVYVPYMDKVAGSSAESVTVTYASPRYVVCKVRKAGIIPFQTKGQYTSTGYSVAAIRTEDTIY